MKAYYNDNDSFCCQWLRNLIKADLIADGDVDERSIADVQPKDLEGRNQVHLFAGIAGWELALQLAGWRADRPVWTASFPCQPFSCAGKQKAGDDKRHLWPEGLRLIRECHPGTVFGEQVPGAIGWGWLDAVFDDLEKEGYACGALVLPACSVGAPHIRQRLYWVADAEKRGQRTDGRAPGQPGHVEQRQQDGAMGHAERSRRPATGRGLEEHTGRELEPGRCTSGGVADAVCDDEQQRQETKWQTEFTRGSWSDSTWLACRDGKSRQVPLEPAFFPVVNGLSRNRVGVLRASGNAIVPPVAAQFVRAFLETEARG